MKTQVWSRTRAVVNTDLPRRCYNGCNFSERTDYGEWILFREYDTPEIAELVMRGLLCERYEYEARKTEELVP